MSGPDIFLFFINTPYVTHWYLAITKSHVFICFIQTLGTGNLLQCVSLSVNISNVFNSIPWVAEINQLFFENYYF